MAEKKKEKPRRRRRVKVLVSKADDSMDLYSRQQTQDPFVDLYGENALLVPPYNYERLFTIYEESDVLQECIEAMTMNVDGFGYQLIFLGDDIKARAAPDAVKEEIKAKNFFDHANEDESFMTIRKKMREDYELFGNGGFEVVRNRIGAAQLLYHLPMRYMRMSKSEGRLISVTENIPRDGRIVPIKIKKRFRRWAQISAVSGMNLCWFKSYGDPRFLDATTGEFKSTAGACKVVASEFMHFKHHFAGLAYGMPRWIGAVLDVMGRRQASFVNWDLFESQGIPPMAILVSGGTLTEESIEELEDLIRSARGAEKWNRTMILESTVEAVGLEDKGTAKIDLKNLSDYRKEDLMFQKYLTATHDNTRYRFRLPPMYVGSAATYTHATAKASQNVAEEQIFVPERKDFDEPVNARIIRKELGLKLWSYKSKGPQIVGSEEIAKGVATFSAAGALSVNQAIDLANQAFALEMSKYDFPWANFPLAIVMKLLEGEMQLKGVEDFASAPKVVTPKPVQPKLLPAATTKMLKTDMFSADEKQLYKTLVMVQDLVERVTENDKSLIM